MSLLFSRIAEAVNFKDYVMPATSYHVSLEEPLPPTVPEFIRRLPHHHPSLARIGDFLFLDLVLRLGQLFVHVVMRRVFDGGAGGMNQHSPSGGPFFSPPVAEAPQVAVRVVLRVLT